jgi:hypothetical protein
MGRKVSVVTSVIFLSKDQIYLGLHRRSAHEGIIPSNVKNVDKKKRRHANLNTM